MIVVANRKKAINLGGNGVKVVILGHGESRHLRDALKAEEVLQDNQEVAVGHHEGRRQHGVAPTVSDHPQHARPDEEDEGEPRDVCDAPRLENAWNFFFFSSI